MPRFAALICGALGWLGSSTPGWSGDSPLGLRLASSATTDDLAEQWTASFAQLRRAGTPVEILRGRYPTDAIEAVIEGRADVALVAREPYESELTAARDAGRGELRFIPIATGSRATRGGTHAIAFFVHASNPVRTLSVAQLREVLAVDGRVRTWGDLGVVGPLAKRDIVVHGQPIRRASGNPPGIVNFLGARILGTRAWRTDLQVHDDAPGGPTALEAIVEAVARDPAAIGWSGFDYGLPGAKTVALGSSREGHFYAGTDAEIGTHDYPLSRFIYACIPVAAAPAAEEFVRMILEPAAQTAIARSVSGFMPLSEEIRTQTVALLQPAPPVPTAAKYRTEDGRIRVVGYNDMREMMTAWTQAFARHRPDIRFDLDLPATRAAVEAVASGRAAFGPIGAELSAEQRARFREINGAEPRQIKVAHASLDPRALSGPLAILVHPSNPRRDISMSELAAIFGGGIRAQGLEPIGLAPDRALGLFFRERVLAGATFGPTFQPRLQSAQVVDSVAANPRAIGFAAAVRANERVRILALKKGDGRSPIELNARNLITNEYPLGRHLWLLLPREAEPWVDDFLKFVLSDAGQRIVAEGSLGYLPLSVKDRQVELQKFQ
jgi:phosphate transport system substrate-binding protein